jgi:predicted DNA-binding transcriptional regulator AlpA
MKDEARDSSDRASALNALAVAPVMSIGDAAQLLGIPLATLFQLRLRGEGPRMFRLGRRLFISQTALREWLARMESTDERAA